VWTIHTTELRGPERNWLVPRVLACPVPRPAATQPGSRASSRLNTILYAEAPPKAALKCIRPRVGGKDLAVPGHGAGEK